MDLNESHVQEIKSAIDEWLDDSFGRYTCRREWMSTEIIPWIYEAAKVGGKTALLELEAEKRVFDDMASDLNNCYDKIEGLSTDLDAAIEVAWKRGAVDWVRMNYPKHYERFTCGES